MTSNLACWLHLDLICMFLLFVRQSGTGNLLFGKFLFRDPQCGNWQQLAIPLTPAFFLLVVVVVANYHADKTQGLTSNKTLCYISLLYTTTWTM